MKKAGECTHAHTDQGALKAFGGIAAARQAGLDLVQDSDHLFFGEFRLLHAELLGMELYFQVDLTNEDASHIGENVWIGDGALILPA